MYETCGEQFFPNCCEPSVCDKSVIGAVERPKCDGVIAVSPAIYTGLRARLVA